MRTSTDRPSLVISRFSALVFCISLLNYAASVSDEQAAVAARSFWAAAVPSTAIRGESLPEVAETLRLEDEDRTLAIGCRMQPGGFVLFSPDTRIPPVMGYSTVSRLRLDPVPENGLYTWIVETMPKTLTMISQRDGSTATAAIITRAEATWESLFRGEFLSSSPTRDSVVGPLLSSYWGQTEDAFYSNDSTASPTYNYYTPNLWPTGCVTTVMGQIMNYFACPQHGTGSHSYQWNAQVLSADFSSHTYDWANILDDYTYPFEGTKSSTLVQRQNVGRLLADLGVAFEAAYTAAETSASLSDAPAVMSAYFGYQEGASEDRTDDTAFFSALDSHLQAGIPVALGIPGHAVVADGLDTGTGTPLYHLNFGWKGSNNGWYSISSTFYSDANETPPNMGDEDISGTYYGWSGGVDEAVFEVLPASSCQVTEDGGDTPVLSVTVPSRVTVDGAEAQVCQRNVQAEIYSDSADADTGFWETAGDTVVRTTQAGRTAWGMYLPGNTATWLVPRTLALARPVYVKSDTVLTFSWRTDYFDNQWTELQIRKVDEPGWTQVDLFQGSSTAWAAESYDLSDIAGQNYTGCTVRFRLVTSYVAGELAYTGDGTGFYIDDFSLTDVNVYSAWADAGELTSPYTLPLSSLAGGDYLFRARTMVMQEWQAWSLPVLYTITDADNDGLPDEWEQQIIDADTNDAIDTIADVLPEDDFDGDGFTNTQEFTGDTDPCDPYSSGQLKVTNLHVAQVSGSRTVEISYDLAGPSPVTVGLAISLGGSSVSAASVSGDIGDDMVPGPDHRIVWEAGSDWDGNAGGLTFNLLCSGTSAAATAATVDARTYTLLISSEHGTGTPAASASPYVYEWGDTVTCAMDVTGVVGYTLSGWSGTGLVPESGTGAATGEIVFQTDAGNSTVSSLTWNWAGPYGGGTGTSDDPYVIATGSQLLALGALTDHYDRSFILTDDIDLTGETFIQAPIAAEAPFTGQFDGNGHVIRNLVIDTGGDNREYLGLFGRIAAGARLSQLALTGGSITGYGSQYVGGLCGANAGTVESCHAHIAVNGNEGAAAVGGLCGANSGTITNCYATGSVTGPAPVGGFCGTNSGAVSKCYARGAVTVQTSGEAHGFCGTVTGGSISACFWDIETSGTDTSAGGVGKTTDEMQTSDTFLAAGWDFIVETANGTEDLWGMDGYPILSWQKDWSVHLDIISAQGNPQGGGTYIMGTQVDWWVTSPWPAAEGAAGERWLADSATDGGGTAVALTDLGSGCLGGSMILNVDTTINVHWQHQLLVTVETDGHGQATGDGWKNEGETVTWSVPGMYVEISEQKAWVPDQTTGTIENLSSPVTVSIVWSLRWGLRLLKMDDNGNELTADELVVDAQNAPIPAFSWCVADASVSLQGMADGGLDFDHWLLDDSITPLTDNPLDLVMDSSHTLTAVFVDGVEEFILELDPGWTLVSLPLWIRPSSMAALYDASLILWRWDNASRAYKELAADAEDDDDREMLPGNGYWVWSWNEERGDWTVRGIRATGDSLDLDAGWHLIGTCGDRKLPSSDALQYPVWGWEAGQYVPADTLLEGHGYWLLMQDHDTLILEAP